MPVSSPWGDPGPKRPRLHWPHPIVIVLLLLLPVLGYLGGRYLERHAFTVPKTRLDVAISALNNGYDRTALSLFQPLAEKGDASAEFHLAMMYEHGWGTAKDGNKALDFYTQAAKQGLVPAEARLEEIYLDGTLVLQDLGKARQWSEMAAKAGSADAQLNLANIYDRGLGVAQDQIEAYAWDALAAARGNILAASRRDKILTTLSPDNQLKAQARANALEALIKPAPEPAEPSPPST
jgi:TPR repeat protein